LIAQKSLSGSYAAPRTNPFLSYTSIVSLKNEMDTNLTKVSGFIQVGNSIKKGRYSSVYLSSNDMSYRAISDSSGNFDFGFIRPGKYKIAIVMVYIRGIEYIKDHELPDTAILDTLTFAAGGIYSINLLKGKLNKDSCCFVGSSFMLPIYFPISSNELDSTSKHLLQYLYQIIKSHNLKIELAFHSDGRFNTKYLSKDTCRTCIRAENARKYLLSLGANPERVIAKGYQGYSPYFINAKTEAQHQKNRRVEVIILAN